MLDGMRQSPERLAFDPPDPRTLPAPVGELFRRNRRVQNLLQRCRHLDRDRFSEVLQEILLHGVSALPELREACAGADEEAARLARSLVRALAPEEIGAQLAAGLLQADARYPVELGALLLARLKDPDLSILEQLRRIDALAVKAAKHVAESLGAPRLDKLVESRPLDVLFRLGEFWKEEGFRGNTEDYYDALNCWLPDALERKTGLPITLSILYLALCRRLGLKAEGVGMPWHFIVRVEVMSKEGQGYLFLDPFHGARPLDLDDCRQLVESGGGQFDPQEHLQAAGAPEILARMCNNLLCVFDHKQQTVDSERVATVMMHLSPRDPVPHMIRAERRMRRGEHRMAREDLLAILRLAPDSPIAAAAEKMLRRIEYEHPF